MPPLPVMPQLLAALVQACPAFETQVLVSVVVGGVTVVTVHRESEGTDALHEPLHWMVPPPFTIPQLFGALVQDVPWFDTQESSSLAMLAVTPLLHATPVSTPEALTVVVTEPPWELPATTIACRRLWADE